MQAHRADEAITESNLSDTPRQGDIFDRRRQDYSPDTKTADQENYTGARDTYKGD